MAALTLVGTAITSVLVVVVVLAVARGIDWRSNEIFAPAEGGSMLRSASGNPVVWALGFLAVALGMTALALAAVGAFPVSLPSAVALAVAPFGLVLFAFLVAGTYAAVRERNVSPAGATLVAALLVAGLMLVAIAAQLMLGP